MKLLKLFGIAMFATAILFSTISCNGNTGTEIANPDDATSNTPDKKPEGNTSDDKNKDDNDNKEDKVTITGAEVTINAEKIASTPDGWAVWTYSLKNYSNKSVKIDFSIDVAVENTNTSAETLYFKILQTGYPTITSKKFETGTTNWTTVTGSIEVELGEDKSIYIPKPSTENLKIYLKNATVNVTELKTIEEIDGSTLEASSWTFKTYDLRAYNNKTVTITFSVDMKVENKGEDAANLMWQVNTSSHPIVASHSFEKGTSDWVTVTGTKEVELGENTPLYLSTYNLTKENLKISLKNVILKVVNPAVNWTTVDSLKEKYVDSGIFDHIGFAVERGELFDITMRDQWNEASHTTKQDVAEGIKHQVNSITMGNEMKPQWFLWHYGDPPAHTKTFTASNGKTIYVPNNIPSTSDPAHGFGGVDSCLEFCKETGIQMRGHVLTWHSQTFDWFFCKDYDISKGLVDKDEMTARHEWYIKSVLDHIAEWEEKNGYAGHGTGKHVIYTWDVVNEAVADDATLTDYYRGTTTGTTKPSNLGDGSNGNSRWYQIYESNEFIINAFRFANKYAPKDVTLCYNDYNEYMEWGGGYKRSGIINLLKAVQEHQKDSELPTRIDAFAMQSHFAKQVPLSDVEYTINEYLKLGLDLQVSELDYAHNETIQNDSKDGSNYYNKSLADLYDSYFKLYQKYAKSNRSGQNGITSVTIWGIEDEKTWLNNAENTYYPLLFERDSSNNLVAKDAFYAVINAAGKTE